MPSSQLGPLLGRPFTLRSLHLGDPHDSTADGSRRTCSKTPGRVLGADHFVDERRLAISHVDIDLSVPLSDGLGWACFLLKSLASRCAISRYSMKQKETRSPACQVRELCHPEPDVYIVGMKSYGRAPTFLMITGYEQVRSVVAALAGDWAAARDTRLVLPETEQPHRTNQGGFGRG